MIWNICLGLSITSILAGLLIFILKKRTGRNELKYLGVGVYLASVIVCFPVNCLEESAGFALIMSISHAIRMFVVDTGVSDITSVLNENLTGPMLLAYKSLVSLLYISAPVFTLGLVLKYFSHFFERLRLAMRWKRDMYVFSELNERSIAIAENIFEKYQDEKKKAGIVFCKSDEKDDENRILEEQAGRIRAVFTPKVLTRTFFRNGKNRKISYFAISEDQSENLSNTLDMIDLLEPWAKGAYMYCFSTEEEAEILIDSKKKGDVRVILFDEIRETVYDHLFRHPLYINLNPIEMKEVQEKSTELRGQQAKQGKITLLIVGGGKVGTEFLKAAAWCGQMNTLDLEIYLIDLKGNIIYKKLAQEYPELIARENDTPYYKIHIWKGNIFSYKTEQYLDQIENITYCVVALGDDEQNIHAGVYLRRYFYKRENPYGPVICAHVRDGMRQDAVWNMSESARSLKNGDSSSEAFSALKNKGKVYYNIIPFGDTRTMFGRQSEASFTMEYLAMGIHFSYWNLGEDANAEMRRSVIRDFYGKQYNRRSSVASGMHIKFKLWEMGYGILKVPVDKKHLEIFRKYVRKVDYRKETEEKRQAFYRLEHERWMAFIRTEGWKLASAGGKSLDAIKACYQSYFGKFKNYNPILKLHPALVPIEPVNSGEASLDEVNDMIVELNRENSFMYGDYDPDYVASDVHLIDAIQDIVDGRWCGSDSLQVRDNRMEKDSCVIAALSDMGCYYLNVYLQLEQEGRTDTVLCLREDIKSCFYGVLMNEESAHGEKAEAYWGLGYMAKAETMPEKAEEYRKFALAEERAADVKPRFDGFCFGQ